MGKATKGYSLVKGKAELRREWHPVRNGGLKPEEVRPFPRK